MWKHVGRGSRKVLNEGCERECGCSVSLPSPGACWPILWRSFSELCPVHLWQTQKKNKKQRCILWIQQRHDRIDPEEATLHPSSTTAAWADGPVWGSSSSSPHHTDGKSLLTLHPSACSSLPSPMNKTPQIVGAGFLQNSWSQTLLHCEIKLRIIPSLIKNCSL